MPPGRLQPSVLGRFVELELNLIADLLGLKLQRRRGARLGREISEGIPLSSVPGELSYPEAIPIAACAHRPRRRGDPRHPRARVL